METKSPELYKVLSLKLTGKHKKFVEGDIVGPEDLEDVEGSLAAGFIERHDIEVRGIDAELTPKETTEDGKEPEQKESKPASKQKPKPKRQEK